MISSAHSVISPVSGLRQPSMSTPTRPFSTACPPTTKPTPWTPFTSVWVTAVLKSVHVDESVELAYFLNLEPTTKSGLVTSPLRVTNFQATQLGISFKIWGTSGSMLAVVIGHRLIRNDDVRTNSSG